MSKRLIIIFFKIYKKYNNKSLAHKITVYSESEKKRLIKSGVAKNFQVKVIGCPRSDYCFDLRNIKPKKNITRKSFFKNKK
jgi:hypothetical protein